MEWVEFDLSSATKSDIAVKLEPWIKSEPKKAIKNEVTFYNNVEIEEKMKKLSEYLSDIKELHACSNNYSESFKENLTELSKYTQLKRIVSINNNERNRNSNTSSNLLSTIEYNQDSNIFATAGVER